MSRREAEIRALRDVIKAYRQATGVTFDAAWRPLVILHLRPRVEAASLRAGLSEASLGVKPLEVKTQRLVWALCP
jgi:hypothetical protein